jgi:arylsulfatase A-like enzyme
MPSQFPNVIFLVVDALWFDRLAVSGHAPSPAPLIDRLAAKGLLASRMFTTGCPTQFAFPSMFTSTLPLDDGGYGSGILNRGISFVERLRESGYATAAFASAGYASRIDGLDRGFDRFHQFFDLSLFMRILRNYHIGYYAQKVAAGEIAPDLFFDRIGALLDRAFAATERFCLDKIDELRQGNVIRSPIIHSWDFDAVIALVRSEGREFAAAPRRYLERLLTAWEKHPLWGAVASAREAPFMASGAYVLEHAMAWIGRRPAQPFFLWAHLMDVHESNYSSFDLLQPRSRIEAETARVVDMELKIREAGPSYRSNRAHDYALAYCDEQVRRLVAFLEAGGLMHNTLFIVTSDHGSWTAGQPRPGLKEVTAFFDQLYHVPFMVVHPDLPPHTAGGLCSTMDIGPTILDILELPIPPSWLGAPVYSGEAGGRTHLVMEHVGRGPCDIDIKPVNICVRTADIKAVFKSEPKGAEATAEVMEVYDLKNDPDERNNLAASLGNDLRIQRLRSIADARISHIRRGAGGPAAPQGKNRVSPG